MDLFFFYDWAENLDLVRIIIILDWMHSSYSMDTNSTCILFHKILLSVNVNAIGIGMVITICSET